jgi:alkanesulfonate monooxygenase SsuD/methylene tetrahydromethanopterin reductase-like flavin-dependent oxidoreductase (luciferase family)
MGETDGMGRGFGVAASVAHDVVGELAREAERLGYSSFWSNDMPDADGLESLAAAAATTEGLRLGVGVMPLDRRTAGSIDVRVRSLDLPHDRLILGIGSGVGPDPLARVRAGVTELEAGGGLTIVVGALGPKMSALAGGAADGVLFNWMTPGYLKDAGEAVRAAAETAGNDRPATMAYVRCALTPAADARLAEEIARYESIPSYQRHLERMGATGRDTCVVGNDHAAMQAGIAPFEAVLDETVVRAITPTDSLDDLLELLRACAPDTDR